MMMMMILNCMLHLCKLSAASETSLREVISDEFMSAIVEAETNEYERLQMEWAVSESLQALNENVLASSLLLPGLTPPASSEEKRFLNTRNKMYFLLSNIYSFKQVHQSSFSL